MNNYKENTLEAIREQTVTMPIGWVSCLHSGCGIGQYTQAMARAMHQQGNAIQVWRKGDSTEQYIHTYPYRSFKNLQHEVAPMYLYQAIQKAGFKASIWHADHIHAATALRWAKPKALTMATVHDVIPLLFSDKSHWRQSLFKYHLAQARKLDHCITVSEKSKADLISFGGFKEKQVSVIHNGIDHERFHPNTIPHYNEVFTIRYVGGLTAPHKNTSLLLYIAKILEDRGLTFNMEIGSGAAHLTQLPQLVASLGLKQVTFKGFIPSEELRLFLAEADVFVYPSLYEGFGFPPLEAMACGTPVVAAAEGSLQEVLGEAACLINANSKDAALNFADAIETLMLHPEAKSTLSEKGIEHVSRYSWQKSAKQLVQLYQNHL